MAADQEGGFTFEDKRRVTEEAPATEPAPAGEPAPTAPEPEEQAGPEGFDPSMLPALSVRDRLLMCIDILNQGAWIALGLISDPATGKVEQNLPQAKLAIDSLAFLSGKVEDDLDDATKRELRNVVSDLQVNYVQRAQ